MKTVTIYRSCKQGAIALQALPTQSMQPDQSELEMELLQLYDDITYQTIQGFGGAFTQAAAEIYSSMPEKGQQEILTHLFSKQGLAYNCGRLPIGSCDFSSGNYSYCDTPDQRLKDFSLQRDVKELFPFVRAALDKTPEMQLMASPWSPPAWMKTNGQMCHGGQLREDCYPLWADYLVKYVQEAGVQGVPISQLTIQNEPKAVQRWESCIYNGEQESRFIKEHLLPALDQAGLGKTQIFIWDHNKERSFIRAREIFSDTTLRKRVHGIAFHWYSGDHFENIRLCSEFFPEKELAFTEGCVELAATNTTMSAKAEKAGRNANPTEGVWEFGEFYAHDIIGNLNNGMTRCIDWNLLLNAQGGPNHVGNYCSVPLICDGARVYKQPSYTFISHFSRFIPRNSQRIAVSKYDSRLEMLAVKTPAHHLVVVVMNPTDTPISCVLSDVRAQQILPLQMEAHSIITAVIADV